MREFRASLKKCACAALAAAAILSVAACGSAAMDTPPEITSHETAAAGTAAESGMHYTQESTVKSARYEKVQDFVDFLAAAEEKFTIPALAQAMIPQGISYDSASGLVYISHYSGGEAASIITASRLETGELQAEFLLKNADGTAFISHVGGLAVTESRVYVSARLDNDGSYSIASVEKSGLPASGSYVLTLEEQIKLPVSPSFMSYCDGVLWIGNFYHPDADYGLSTGIEYTTPTQSGDYGCYILGYELENGAIPAYSGEFPVPDLVLCAPDRIQGMAYDGGRVLLSQSYGRKNNSAILMYKLDLGAPADTELSLAGEQIPMYILDAGREMKTVTAMPMTEGLALTESGVLVLFESGAMKYSDGKFRTDKVWELQID